MRAIGQQSRPIVLRASRYAPRAAARSAKVPKADAASGAPLRIPHAAIHPLAAGRAARGGTRANLRRAWDERDASSAAGMPRDKRVASPQPCASMRRKRPTRPRRVRPNSPASLSRLPDLGSLRTLPHGSGRSPASRDEPLTPGTRRPLRRGAACGAERAASGRPYQRSNQTNAMPTCSQCFHGGKHHDWTSPPCSAPRCFCIREHPRRMRGRCLVPGCPCSHYAALDGRTKPVNPYIGKARR